MKQLFQVQEPADFLPIIEQIYATDPKDKALVIALKGDLGAGKTTFTQELARFLQIDEQVVSPTFTIMKQYPITNKKFEHLVHIDAYRIESEDEVGPLHLEALMNNPDNVICIEWPQQIANIIPTDAVTLALSIVEGETREVHLSISD